MQRAITGSILRWIHIVFSIPILGYIYSPFEEIPKYAGLVRFVVVPVMLLSGLWMWKGHVLRRLVSRTNRMKTGEELEVYTMNPSERIDELIAGLTDWRGKTLAGVRKSILEADREIIEEWKWMGSPVWSRDGIIAVGNAHKDKVKLTFSHGASLPDLDKLFNAGLGGNAWRAIDLFEGDKINARALKNLVRAAVDYNQSKLNKKAPAGARAKAHKAKK